ncbi:hypothetical protein [Skermania piniformis]|uniref:Uncharacterized protein n=1 Tax=Skermania pinensis TaxID=39122 RepID=A0ABX8SCF5_9ACTN|nr:hypothetical protein [Skermania piniformis]QXQ14862.1 hypothetical protein KV203_05625 [Skermania piniformis]
MSHDEDTSRWAVPATIAPSIGLTAWAWTGQWAWIVTGLAVMVIIAGVSVHYPRRPR